MRRPGRVGPAPVAGAIAAAFAAGWVTLLHYGGYERLGVWASIRPTSYNFAVWACAAALLFVAWAGPLGQGEGEVEGPARRVVRLPQAAIALGLGAVAVAGLL